MSSVHSMSEEGGGGVRRVVVPVLHLEGTPGWSGQTSPVGVETREEEMVPLEVDSDRETPIGLKEEQSVSDVAPTFVNLDQDVEVAGSRAPPPKGKLYYLAVCFLVNFAAFLPAQALITTVFGKSGFWGLFSLYICFSISAFFATPIIKAVGVRTVLFAGACANTTFIASCIPAYLYKDTVGWLFFVGCVAMGVFGAPLWVAQGVYMSRLTQHHPEVVGVFNGTFLGIFFTCGIFGNTLVSIIGFTFETLPIVPIFACLLCLGVAAAILFKFLPEPPVPITPDPPVKELFQAMWHMASDKGILLMAPYWFYLGVGCTFAWGVVPQLVPDKRLVAPIAAVYGIGTLSASFISGRVFDDFGWKPLAAANFVIVIVGFFGVEIAYRQKLVWIFFISSVLFGAFEALANTLALSIIMRQYTKRAPTAFFYYRFLTGFGNAMGFLLGLAVPYNWEMFILAAMCGLTLVLMAFFLMYVGPAEEIADKNQFTDDGA